MTDIEQAAEAAWEAALSTPEFYDLDTRHDAFIYAYGVGYRAAEPPHPASVGGVDEAEPLNPACPVPRQLTDASLRKMLTRVATAEGKDFVAKIPGFAFDSVVSELLWSRARIIELDGALDGLDVVVDKLAGKVVDLQFPQLYGPGAVEPPHPSNEELVATVRDGLRGGRSWRDEEAATASLSELERRLTVRA